MKQFNPEEFKNKGGYFQYDGDGFHICLEPCLNGCDVAVYDKDLMLLEPKFCCDLPGFGLGEHPSPEQQIKMLALAQEKAKEYFDKYSKETHD